MKLKNPLLPYIFVVVLPFFHIGLGFKDLASDSGGMIVGPLFLMWDGMFGLVLLRLLLSKSLRWQTRALSLMVVGALIVTFWVSGILLGGKGLLAKESLTGHIFFGGQFLAFIIGVLMLNRHKYLREIV